MESLRRSIELVYVFIHPSIHPRLILTKVHRSTREKSTREKNYELLIIRIQQLEHCGSRYDVISLFNKMLYFRTRSRAAIRCLRRYVWTHQPCDGNVPYVVWYLWIHSLRGSTGFTSIRIFGRIRMLPCSGGSKGSERAAAAWKNYLPPVASPITALWGSALVKYCNCCRPTYWNRSLQALKTVIEELVSGERE